MNNQPVKVSGNGQKGQEEEKEVVDKVSDEENKNRNKNKKDKTGKHQDKDDTVLGEINDN